MHRHRPGSWPFFLLLFAPPTTGCGGATQYPAAEAPPAAEGAPEEAATPDMEAPMAEPGNQGAAPDAAPDFATLADAEGALATAVAELDAVVGAVPSAEARDESGTAGPAKRAPAPRTLAASTSSCQAACRALDSQRRAASAICRLTSNGDPRCANARATVARNEQRVASCSCSPAQ
ncbi:MAG: hypothetical protein JW751_06175 [Polyangiaceae bacterium]|nr:hypothetical protein [Polyangiaceae bacterium]